MIELHAGELLVRLATDDARTAQDAGARVAHALAGAAAANFMVALAEQGDLIRRATMDAGFSAGQARLAAKGFEVARGMSGSGWCSGWSWASRIMDEAQRHRDIRPPPRRDVLPG